MPLELRTRDLNWKKVLRETEIFCALVTPAWHRDRLMQRQYAYARQVGKPIVLLIQAGTALPVHADEHTWYVWGTPQELADLVRAIERGTEPRPEEPAP